MTLASVAFSPSGERVAVVGGDGHLRALQADSGTTELDVGVSVGGESPPSSRNIPELGVSVGGGADGHVLVLDEGICVRHCSFAFW